MNRKEERTLKIKTIKDIIKTERGAYKINVCKISKLATERGVPICFRSVRMLLPKILKEINR